LSICLLNIRYFIVEQHILLYSNAFCFGELEFTQIINTCLHILSFFNYFIARSNRLSFRMQMFLERENTKLCHLYAVSEMLSVIIQIPSTACMVWYENFTNSIYIYIYIDRCVCVSCVCACVPITFYLPSSPCTYLFFIYV
jgi:hypothetical protein